VVDGPRWLALWVDVYVPRDAPAGTYLGTASVGGDALHEQVTVELRVHDATLSDDFACEVGLNNYGSIGRKGSDLRLRYYQMAHRHRLAIHEHFIQTATTGSGARMRGEWSAYDAEMGEYLSGQAFTSAHGYRGPGEGRPVRWLYLPVEIAGSHAWPLPAECMRQSEYDEAVVAMVRDFATHFAARGWTATELMFFVNGLDEPTKPGQIADIRYFGDLCRRAAAARVHYRADINHLHDIERFDIGYTEQRVLDELGPVIDLWVCVADFQRTDFSVLLPRRQPPRCDTVWFYQNREPSVGGYTLDDETIGLRTWPVICWKYGLDGCVLWELTYTGQSADIWRDPRNSVNPELVHNLAGLLAYPGRAGTEEPVASIRLKMFRRGAQDYEYLRLLEQAAGRQAAQAILDPLVPAALHRPGREYGAPGSWSHDPEAWERMRLEVLEAIEGSR
ncbi:MAG: glycoside hydrolase domain-containing protein, partial [Candidatus Latescibacterota bacterium]